MLTMDWNTFAIEPGSSVTDAVIAQVQQQLGVLLPALYLDLVRYAEEASPEVSCFSYGLGETCISEFFTFSAETRPDSLLWYAQRVQGLPAGYRPIARDAGGWLICLDFNSPSVAVELFATDSQSSHWVAPYFEAFVQLWRD